MAAMGRLRRFNRSTEWLDSAHLAHSRWCWRKSFTEPTTAVRRQQRDIAVRHHCESVTSEFMPCGAMPKTFGATADQELIGDYIVEDLGVLQINNIEDDAFNVLGSVIVDTFADDETHTAALFE